MERKTEKQAEETNKEEIPNTVTFPTKVKQYFRQERFHRHITYVLFLSIYV